MKIDKSWAFFVNFFTISFLCTINFFSPLFFSFLYFFSFLLIGCIYIRVLMFRLYRLDVFVSYIRFDFFQVWVFFLFELCLISASSRIMIQKYPIGRISRLLAETCLREDSHSYFVINLSVKLLVYISRKNMEVQTTISVDNES